MIKQCSKCKLFKEINEFLYLKKRNNYEAHCRSCTNLNAKKWRKNNKEKIKERDKKYYNTEKYKKWRAEYRKRPDVLVKERAQTISYRSQPDNHEKRAEYLNRPEVNERNKMLRKENNKRLEVKEQKKEQRIEYKNRPEIKEKLIQYRKLRQQCPEFKERNNKWRRAYRKKNPYINLRNRISRAIRLNIKKGRKNKHWEELVGYTLAELMSHIESQFTEGMTWDKFLNGEIHIDHIIPISRFNYSTYSDIDFTRCWALSNLQPMWAKENMSKGNKIKEPFQPCLALEIEAC